MGGQEVVVAVRRLAVGVGSRSHCAGYYSFGVHAKHLRKGYGQAFYDAFDKVLQEEYPEVTRVEFTQSYGNVPAITLAVNNGFKAEANFPEWLARSDRGPGGVYHLPERFVARVSPAILPHTQRHSWSFKLSVPAAVVKELAIIERKENTFYCYDANKKLLGKWVFSPGPRVVSHIGFVEIELEPGVAAESMIAALRAVTLILARETGVKKIEVFTDNDEVAKLLGQLGHFYRGEKIASKKIGDTYYCEAGTDFSFFTLEDARLFLQSTEFDDYSKKRVEFALKELEKALSSIIQEGLIDDYMRLYCESLAFQFIREQIGPFPIKDLDSKQWHHLLESLPELLRPAFTQLQQALKQRQPDEQPTFLETTLKHN